MQGNMYTVIQGASLVRVLILPGNGVNVGDVYYYDGEFDAYQRTYVLSNIKASAKYVYYHMFHYWRERNLNKQFGSATNFIKMGNFSDYEIPIPPLPEQQRIVSLLDETFAGLAQVHANAERNLVNARELFESVLREAFENGEGWEENKLGDVCEISSKLVDPRIAEFLDLPHVGGGNIVSKQGTLIELKTAKEEGLISGKFLFDEEMILYSKIRPYLMKVVRPDFKGLCSADIYPLLPIHNKIIRDYLYYLLLTPNFTEYAIKGSARAGMPKVNREHLFEYMFYLPSLAEQRAIVARLDVLAGRRGSWRGFMGRRSSRWRNSRSLFWQKHLMARFKAAPSALAGTSPKYDMETFYDYPKYICRIWGRQEGVGWMSLRGRRGSWKGFMVRRSSRWRS